MLQTIPQAESSESEDTETTMRGGGARPRSSNSMLVGTNNQQCRNNVEKKTPEKTGQKNRSSNSMLVRENNQQY